MSYLHTPRIIFTGDFQADVSTVNNDVRHYDIDHFESRFHIPRDWSTEINNGSWNPEGGGTFRFINCHVVQGILPNDQVVSSPAADMIIGSPITGSPDVSSGKLVDIDPQMQMGSELWGVRLRLSTPEGELLLEGEIQPSGFRDLQVRQFPNMPGDQHFARNNQGLGACWPSVMTNLKWGPQAMQSPLLRALKLATRRNKIALQLTSFGFYLKHADGRFAMGRLLGCLGPWLADEPELFPAARRLYGTVSYYYRYSNFRVDQQRRQLSLDLGGSYPINDPLGYLNVHFPSVKVAVARKSITIPQASPDRKFTIAPDQFLEIGTVTPADPNSWLMSTAGIVHFPLTDEAATLLKDHQLLLLIEEAGEQVIYARESVNGIYIRSEQFIVRMDPGQQQRIRFFAYQWGRPLEGARINIALMPPLPGLGGGLDQDPTPPRAKIPLVNFPAGKIQHTQQVTTNKKGRAVCIMTGGDPGFYREYLDGQLYMFAYTMEGFPELDRYDFFGMILDMICVHLRDKFDVPARPDWDDVAPLWIQFGNLYPIMSKHIMRMDNMESILRFKDILLHAFTRDINDPTYMPVTRDLSRNKIQTLIKWLKRPLPGKGTKHDTPLSDARDNGEPVNADAEMGNRINEVTKHKSGFKDVSTAHVFNIRYTIQSID